MDLHIGQQQVAAAAELEALGGLAQLDVAAITDFGAAQPDRQRRAEIGLEQVRRKTVDDEFAARADGLRPEIATPVEPADRRRRGFAVDRANLDRFDDLRRELGVQRRRAGRRGPVQALRRQPQRLQLQRDRGRVAARPRRRVAETQRAAVETGIAQIERPGRRRWGRLALRLDGCRLRRRGRRHGRRSPLRGVPRAGGIAPQIERGLADAQGADLQPVCRDVDAGVVEFDRRHLQGTFALPRRARLGQSQRIRTQGRERQRQTRRVAGRPVELGAAGQLAVERRPQQRAQVGPDGGQVERIELQRDLGRLRADVAPGVEPAQIVAACAQLQAGLERRCHRHRPAQSLCLHPQFGQIEVGRRGDAGVAPTDACIRDRQFVERELPAAGRGGR